MLYGGEKKGLRKPHRIVIKVSIGWPIYGWAPFTLAFTGQENQSSRYEQAYRLFTLKYLIIV